MKFVFEAVYIRKKRVFLLADVGLSHVPGEIKKTCPLGRIYCPFWLYSWFVLGGRGGLSGTGNLWLNAE